MRNMNRHYIDGRWQAAPGAAASRRVLNPATEQPVARLRMATRDDVESAIAAAQRALADFARTDIRQRAALLQRIAEIYERRLDEIALAITTETGAPYEQRAKRLDAPAGLRHLRAAAMQMPCETDAPSEAGLRLRAAAGVCALITPWHGAVEHIAGQLAPALLAGCTVLVKPSNLAPLSAHLLADIVHEAGVPAGVFNLIHGREAETNRWIAAHPQVDMVSFAGSATVAASIVRDSAAAPKQVSIEICRRPTDLLLDGAAIARAVAHSVRAAMCNGGACADSPSRLLVPAAMLGEAARLASDTVTRLAVGDPLDARTAVGPIAGAALHQKWQTLLAARIDARAELLAGGPGRPAELIQGYYARPTVFAASHDETRFAGNDDFGPMLTLVPYRDEREAIALVDHARAATTRIWSGDPQRAGALARRLRAGSVRLNDAGVDAATSRSTRAARIEYRHDDAPDDFTKPKTIAGAVGERTSHSSTRSQR